MFILERAILFIKQRPRPLHARVCTEDRARDLRESVSRAVLLKLSTVVTERNLSPPPLAAAEPYIITCNKRHTCSTLRPTAALFILCVRVSFCSRGTKSTKAAARPTTMVAIKRVVSDEKRADGNRPKPEGMYGRLRYGSSSRCGR